ncbi:MAG: PEGA domain-containing protein [bacterium]
MFKQAARWSLIILASMALFACAEAKREVSFEVTASLDGNSAAQARVLMDGTEVGTTGSDGLFSHKTMRLSGEEVKISVIMEAPGHKVAPWEGSFKVKKPGEVPEDKYSLEAILRSTKSVTFSVNEKGNPIEGALIKLDGKKVAATDPNGEIIYEYTGESKKTVKLDIARKGYVPWRKTVEIEAGKTVAVAIFKPSVLTIKALTEEYGQEKSLEGVSVKIGKNNLGKTDADGSISYVYRGAPGKAVTVSISAPGYTPSLWKARVVLDGRRSVKRYFYSTALKPVRTGIYGYSSNVLGADVTPLLNRIEEAVGNILFSHMIFNEVPGDTLKENIRQAETDIGRITATGWENTTLIKAVDVVILGSVSKRDRRFTIETKVYTSDGSLVLSQINSAKGEKNIKGVAKKIVKNIVARFPFRGTLVSTKDENRINIGKSQYQLKKGMEFALMAPNLAKYGKLKSYRDIGTLKLRKVRKTSSTGEIVELTKDAKVWAGQRVVRRIVTSREKHAAGGSITLLVKGGVPPDVDPLPGTNVYIDDQWAGTTDRRGTLQIPLKIGRTYDIVLYRHGYQQLSDRLKANQDKGKKEYTLGVNNALLRVESMPSSAEILLDGIKIGATPMLGGKQVKFGFHTLKLTTGGNYRDFEEVLGFNRKEINLTGSDKIVFVRDYIKQGKRAEMTGDIDGAIKAYGSPGKSHPDYSSARFRLAQLYMDERDDYASAIREFENVLSMPENQQLIYKQFSVAYTNLGHAYYELGNKLIREDRLSAGEKFSKATVNLEKAKLNTRFFPTLHYDEAIHDTYYYLALSYHKLYLLIRKETLLGKADLAWREYFDFFPKQLETEDAFAQIRDSAQKYWTQIQDLM